MNMLLHRLTMKYNVTELGCGHFSSNGTNLSTCCSWHRQQQDLNQGEGVHRVNN